MTVGSQPNSATIDNQLTNYALQLRNLMQSISNLSMEVNANNTGVANMEAVGYSSQDAATVLQVVGYMNTIAGVYFGTVQAGGNGGTGAIDFNYNSGLSSLWNGS